MTEPILLNEEVKQRVAERHPFRGLGKPQDIANAALFLVSEENTWVTGVCIPVDGGFTIG